MSTTRPRNETNGSLVVNDMPSFWRAVDQVEASLRTFKENVANISSMQSRLLNSVGNSNIEQRLDALSAETKTLSHTLRNQIKQLEATGSQTEQGIRRTKRLSSTSLRLNLQLTYSKGRVVKESVPPSTAGVPNRGAEA
ncbi:3547_t:CDS:1 [Acaulospora colombiana]|uniref:3547_t:CDS:1 n=1 Tax=Acaulospora colombiana TaxID=27376 RepID=A0ACA9M0H2_9GLOM|nr:3547_t:CDS:1 [Acaulospora colombiana]